jgi:hypothetical protein
MFLSWPISAGLPSAFLPILPIRSGRLDETSPTPANLWNVFLQSFLAVVQLAFLASLIPLAFIGLPSLYILYVLGFVVANQYFSVLLNGRRRKGCEFKSNDKYLHGRKIDEHEKWIYINGICCGYV